ncbi:MAG: pirin-like C-terminal cupin domain-containing protein, partial [Janthinobacterium lividum]
MSLRAGPKGARLLLLGGAVMDGPRYLFWNFVSSSRARIEQAKADWKAGRFGTVPGDDREFIPLPELKVAVDPAVQAPAAGAPTS